LLKIVDTGTDHVMKDMKVEIMGDAEDTQVPRVVVHVEKEVTTEIVTETIEEEMIEIETIEGHQDDHLEDLQEGTTEIEEIDTD